jgi:hypothetical protein
VLVFGIPAIFLVLGLFIAVFGGVTFGTYRILSKQGLVPALVSVRADNDLNRPVVLALCDSRASCAHPSARIRIGAGGTTSLGGITGMRIQWAVESPDGQLLRCMILHWSHAPGSAQLVRLSNAPRWSHPCSRETPTTSLNDGR